MPPSVFPFAQFWFTFPRGFVISSSLCHWQLGLSVSTTHCLIGAITGVALVEGSGGINQATIKKIVMSWIVTLPASAVLGVMCYTPVSMFFASDVSTAPADASLVNSF